MKYLSIISYLLTTLLISCNASKKIDHTAPQENKIVLGTVTHIENGRDGYTAKIKTPNGEIYFALISITNLGNNNGYVDFRTNDQIAVKGKQWMLENKTQLTVQKIISSDNEHHAIKGVVQSVTYGIDGYIAKIKSEDGENYEATISLPNLGDNHENYRDYQVGDPIAVIGELWLIGDQLRITVRDIVQ